MNKLTTLRILAVIEATSFLALLVATVVKHSGGSEQGVSILGPFHGVFFLAFCWSAISCAQTHRWPAKTTMLVLVGGVIPFGGYVVERHFAGEQDEIAT